MKTLKSLAQAIKLNKGQLTATQILNGNIYTVKGWERFNVTDELRENVAQQIVEILGGQYKTKNRVFNAIKYGGVSHWGLDRMLIDTRVNYQDKRKKDIVISYCAGQDYPYECNVIRTDLKNL